MAELNGIAHQPTLAHDRDSPLPFASDIPDVYSPSIWAGWYSGRYTEYKAAAEKEAAAVDRMLHIEWGGDSHAGRHSENPTASSPNLDRRGRGGKGIALPAHRARRVRRAMAIGRRVTSATCSTGI